MFKNYLKVTLRNFVRHKGYSLINIIGKGGRSKIRAKNPFSAQFSHKENSQKR